MYIRERFTSITILVFIIREQELDHCYYTAQRYYTFLDAFFNNLRCRKCDGEVKRGSEKRAQREKTA